MKLKNKHKKILKILAFLVAMALTLGICLFANALNGNPFSKYLATKSAEIYLAQTYGDTDFVLGEVNYNFKTGGYYARISSPSSIDSHFTLDLSLFGEFQRDYYENDVLDGYNTFMRCDEEYRTLVDSVFSAPEFPYIGELDFGTVNTGEEMRIKLMESLQVDQEFDYEALGKEYGELTFYAQDKEITLEKASEILLGIKQFFDEEQVYFYKIDFVLQNIWVDGEKNFDGPEIHIDDFLYSDIYSEGMLERVTKANEETKAYYEAEDEKTANLMPENIDT